LKPRVGSGSFDQNLWLLPIAGRRGWKRWGDAIRAARTIEIAGPLYSGKVVVRIAGVPELLFACW
jgi:hypothetical protein